MLKDYKLKYPDTVIIDDYSQVHRLDDRLEMLEVLAVLHSSLSFSLKLDF